jgi:6-phosphogluconate dehydrogenase
MSNFDKTIAIIGLGKMGSECFRELHQSGFSVLGWDKHKNSNDFPKLADAISPNIQGLQTADVFWLSVPHWAFDEVLDNLSAVLEPQDTVIDAGNSKYTKSRKRGHKLQADGIAFVDAGVSGGPEAFTDGAAIMAGGKKSVIEDVRPIFRALTAEGGFQHMGEIGAGHYTKMVHNAIEYGMLQALAEGMELLKADEFTIDIEQAAKVYNHGSVIESKLTDYLEDGLEIYGSDITDASTTVAAGGTGDWALATAKKLDTTRDVLKAAVEFRRKSDENPTFSGKVIQLLRHMFGGHDINAEEHDN